jgi:hypothetical protein
MIRRLALVLALLPAAAAAQTATGTVDIDGDGRVDTFRIAPSPESDDGPCVDLTIEAGGRTTTVPHVVCGADPYENGVELQPTSSGAMRIVASHYGIGRNKWDLTLTLVGRKGQILVGGYTFDWHDSLDPEDNGSCDLNLLTGKGVLTVRGIAKAVVPSLKAMPVADWTDDPRLPECDVG